MIQSVSSAFYSLFHNNTAPEEVVHTWNVNDFVIKLIRNQNTLKCITTHTTGAVYTESIEIPPSKTIEQFIAYFKLCQVLIGENGIPSFLHNHNTWVERDKTGEVSRTIHLLQGTDDLIWDIFSSSIGKNSCFYFKDATIPSARCHPETIALIEKIKANSLVIDSISHLKNDFKATRILDKETIEKECKELKREIQVINFERYIIKNSNQSLMNSPLVIPGVVASGAGSVFLAWNTISGTAGAVSSFFGGGVLGTIAGGCAGYAAGICAVTAAGIPLGIGLATYHILRARPDIEKQQNTLRNRIQIFSPEKPLFVEIEPISEPSRIDQRLRVSKFTWAVTLVMHGGSTGDHTQIIVEGINNGLYGPKPPRLSTAKIVPIGKKFIHLAHYQPYIESGLFPPEKLTFTKRTEIWMKSSKKTADMLQQIQREISLQKKQKSKQKKLPIALFGCDSLTSGGSHSCFTWAREKIQMIDIDLGKSKIGFIATIPRTYMKTQEEWEKLPVTMQI